MVDAQLTRPGTIRLLGGAAISLAHVPSYVTRDVDYTWADREVGAAVREVAASQPELVRATQTGTFFAPCSHEDRLEALEIPGLVFLRVLVPERHDLAIMKLTRGLTRDLEAIVEIHDDEPFDLETLVERYDDTWVAGQQSLLDAGFRCALSAMYGEAEAETAMELLADIRARKARGVQGEPPRGPRRRRR